ncbi:MAG: hypothetical protein WKF81_00730 [Thermomicrobiales bacterium]
MDFLNQQFNQFNQQPQQKSFWQQSLRARYGFMVGIVVGVLLGWFFHGIVSLVIRLGLVMLLLIPIFIIGWLFLRSRRPQTAGEGPGSGPRVFTIGSVPPFMRGSSAPSAESPSPREREPVIDLNADDYDLEQFKKRLERES